MKKISKILVFTCCSIPFLFLVWRVLQNDFGPDPVQELSKATGEWALKFLVLALAIAPIRHLTGLAAVIRHRRMIGLYALFYASVHFLVWMMFVLEFRWSTIAEEIIERPYITIGFSAYVILVVLGLTSPKFMVRRLGKSWKRLHRLVYVASILAVIHLLWIQRTDVGEPFYYGLIILCLLGYRFWRYKFKPAVFVSR